MKDLLPPTIEPINVKQYEFKQSPYPQADKLPLEVLLFQLHKVVKVSLYKILY